MLSNRVCQPSEVGVKSPDGGAGHESGPVVDIVGAPLTNWTMGGENQCPLPLYLISALEIRGNIPVDCFVEC